MTQAESTAAQRPLAGLRVIDLSTYVAGPSGAMTLAQLGADVIRVDPIGGATDVRRLPLDSKGNSLYWAGLNKARRSVEVDLRSEEGRDLVRSMLALPGEGNGILLTNAVGRRWLDYESLRAHRSDLIMVHIKGQQDGTPAVDYTVNSEVGLPLITGPPESRLPVNHVLPAWDLLTGLNAAVAILAAERARRRTGHGQLITTALADVAVANMCHLGFVADVVVNRHERQREGNYLYGSFGCDFETADGGRVMVVALTPRHWDKLVRVTGIGETIDALERSLETDLREEEERYKHREVLAALIRPWFASRTLEEVSEGLDDAQVLWGTYRSIEDFVSGPESLLQESSIVRDVEHPGIGTFPTPRSVLRFLGEDEERAEPAPLLGQDTGAVLGSLLDLGAEELEDLRVRDVIGG